MTFDSAVLAGAAGQPNGRIELSLCLCGLHYCTRACCSNANTAPHVTRRLRRVNSGRSIPIRTWSR